MEWRCFGVNVQSDSKTITSDLGTDTKWRGWHWSILKGSTPGIQISHGQFSLAKKVWAWNTLRIIPKVWVSMWDTPGIIKNQQQRTLAQRAGVVPWKATAPNLAAPNLAAPNLPCIIWLWAILWLTIRAGKRTPAMKGQTANKMRASCLELGDT